MCASPQKEDGYTPIAHTILEALSTHVISPDEWRVLMIILRKTYGWDKKEDCISNSQFAGITGISRNHIPRIINKLVSRNIIYRVSPIQGTGVPHSGDAYIIKYGFQKDFDKWHRCPPFRGLSPKQDLGVPHSGPKASPEQGHTKESITKETIQKKITACNPQIREFLIYYGEEFKSNFGTDPVIEWGKDGAITKNLLKIIPLKDLKDLLEKFFSSEDKFIIKSGYTIGIFKSQINKLKIGADSKHSGLKAWANEIREEEQNGREG